MISSNDAFEQSLGNSDITNNETKDAEFAVHFFFLYKFVLTDCLDRLFILYLHSS